jgi:AraC-like DNA-binding protein
MLTDPRTRPELERLALPEDASFVWKAIHGRHFEAPFHHHPEIELTFITAGFGRRFVGETVEAFAPGDAVLLGAHLPHAWFSDSRCRRSEAVVIHFHAEKLNAGVLSAREFSGVRDLLREAAGGVVVSAAVVAEISGLLAALPASTGAQRLLLFLEVLVRLAGDPHRRCLGATSSVASMSAMDRKRLHEVLRFLHDQHVRPIALADAAKAAGLGPEAFSRFFRRVTGRTFIETLTQIRLASALGRLRESTDTVAAIAHDCGFEHLSSFNRHFRRHYGFTPSDARFRNVPLATGEES